MKTIFFILSIFFMMQTGFTQPGEYTGPAKVAVKSFWDGASRLEKSIAAGGSSLDVNNLGSLARKVEDIKKRDPAYNTSEMEAKLKSFMEGITELRNKNDAAMQAYRDKSSNAQKTSDLLRVLFQVNRQVDNGKLSVINERINEYKKNTAEVLAMDLSNNKSDLETQLKYVKLAFKNAERELTELDRRCREQTDAENAKVNYYELKFNQAYWDAAQKVYADEADFKKAYSLATKLMDGLGSVDDMVKLATQAKELKIKNTLLPASVVKDVALEKLFIETFNKYHGEEFKCTAIKAVILSEDWSIVRHEVTGIVVGRSRYAAIVFKGKDGKCYRVSNFFILQEYVGNSFGNTRSQYPVMGGNEMLCENVK